MMKDDRGAQFLALFSGFRIGLVFASGWLGWCLSAGSRIGLVLVSDGMGPLWPTRLSHLGWDPFRLGRNHSPLRFEAERRTTTKV